MVHMGDSNHSHYVLAYGFTNNGRSTSDIMVLDPYNPDTSSPVGAYRSLRDSIDVEIVAIYGNNANLTDYDVCGLVYTELKD